MLHKSLLNNSLPVQSKEQTPIAAEQIVVERLDENLHLFNGEIICINLHMFLYTFIQVTLHYLFSAVENGAVAAGAQHILLQVSCAPLALGP